MLTRLREGTPEAADEARAGVASADAPEAVGGAPLSIDNLGHSFGELRAIERIDLEAEPGEVVGIVGPSGCGKTTLLELVAGLRPADTGDVSVGGHAEPGERLARCAYMPQRDLLLPWLSAVDNACLALRIAGVPRTRARARAAEHFERLGLEGFERSRPDQLSGGMRQRIAFLRTLMAGRPVLLLDEPFASLDAITRAEMQQWLAAVLGPTSGGAPSATPPGASRQTVLLVTHDVEEALYLSDRVLVLGSRPATVADRIEVDGPRAADRAAAVTSPEFAELRQRALRALARAAR